MHSLITLDAIGHPPWGFADNPLQISPPSKGDPELFFIFSLLRTIFLTIHSFVVMSMLVDYRIRLYSLPCLGGKGWGWVLSRGGDPLPTWAAP
jgi:hypothetical protein